MLSMRGGKSVIHAELAVQQQSRLRCTCREGTRADDGHNKLRPQDHGIKLSNGRSQLKLSAHTVQQKRREFGSLTQFHGVRAAAKNAVHSWQAVSAHGSIGIGVMKAVSIHAQEGVVSLVYLVIKAQESHPPGVVTHKNAGSHWRRYG